jgi:hypothetical protein
LSHCTTTQTQVRPGRDPPGSGGIAPSSVYFYTPPGCERGVNHRPLDFIQQKCRLTIRTHESRYARCRSHLSQSRGTFTNAHRIVSCAAPKSNLGIAKHHVNENLPNPAVQGMSVSSPANSQYKRTPASYTRTVDRGEGHCSAERSPQRRRGAIGLYTKFVRICRNRENAGRASAVEMQDAKRRRGARCEAPPRHEPQDAVEA